jgi:hypothetical protein
MRVRTRPHIRVAALANVLEVIVHLHTRDHTQTQPDANTDFRRVACRDQFREIDCMTFDMYVFTR